MDGVTEAEIDDSWEDDTGLVRARAKNFVTKGQRHDPGKLPPGSSSLRPSLPLLYDIRGTPSEPMPPMGISAKEYDAWFERFSKEHFKDPETGQFKMGMATLAAVGDKMETGWPEGAPYPSLTQVAQQRLRLLVWASY